MGLTSKYCDKDIKHDEDNDGEDKRMTEGKWRRKAMKTVLFKNIVFIASALLRHKSPLPLTILPIAIGGVRPSPTIPCRSSGSRTGAARQPRQRRQRDFLPLSFPQFPVIRSVHRKWSRSLDAAPASTSQPTSAYPIQHLIHLHHGAFTFHILAPNLSLCFHQLRIYSENN